jgi:hypothetical protein
VEDGRVLELLDQKLKFLVFSSYLYGGFSVTPTRCSVKYARNFKLLIGLILVY